MPMVWSEGTYLPTLTPFLPDQGLAPPFTSLQEELVFVCEYMCVCTEDEGSCLFFSLTTPICF